MSTNEWVRAARKHAQLTQDGLAEKLEMSKGNVSGWENGRHKPSFEQMKRIAALTGYPLPLEGVANTEPGPDAKGRYPLISEVQAGMWTELCDHFQPGDAEQWLPSTKNLGECGYMLRVKGNSMEDPGGRYSFPDGMVLHVNPHLTPTPNQFVIVRREATKEATFKRYVLIDGEPYLEAINPDWPKDKKFLKLQPGDAWCGVVVDASLGGLP